MGEISKVVTERYPVEKLPEELRRGIESGQSVRVTVEAEEVEEKPARSFQSFLGSAPGLDRSPEEVVEFIRMPRNESGR